jgi:hypothetical protein
MNTKNNEHKDSMPRFNLFRFFYFIDIRFFFSIISYIIFTLMFRLLYSLTWEFMDTALYDLWNELLSFEWDSYIPLLVSEYIEELLIPHLTFIGLTYATLFIIYLSLGKLILFKNLYKLIKFFGFLSYTFFAIYFELYQNSIMSFFLYMDVWYLIYGIIIPLFIIFILIRYLNKLHRLKFKIFVDYPTIVHGLEIAHLKKIVARTSKKRELEDKYKSDFDALSNHR